MLKQSIATIMAFGAVAIVSLTCTSTFAQRAKSTAFGNGMHQYYSGRYNEAIMSMDSAIGEMPNDPRPYVFRGLARMGMGNTGAARADFQQGARIEAGQKRYSSLLNRSLERVQGSHRLEIEKARRDARNGGASVPNPAVVDNGVVLPNNTVINWPATVVPADYVVQEVISSPVISNIEPGQEIVYPAGTMPSNIPSTIIHSSTLMVETIQPMMVSQPGFQPHTVILPQPIQSFQIQPMAIQPMTAQPMAGQSQTIIGDTQIVNPANATPIASDVIQTKQAEPAMVSTPATSTDSTQPAPLNQPTPSTQQSAGNTKTIQPNAAAKQPKESITDSLDAVATEGSATEAEMAAKAEATPTPTADLIPKTDSVFEDEALAKEPTETKPISPIANDPFANDPFANDPVVNDPVEAKIAETVEKDQKQPVVENVDDPFTTESEETIPAKESSEIPMEETPETESPFEVAEDNAAADSDPFETPAETEPETTDDPFSEPTNDPVPEASDDPFAESDESPTPAGDSESTDDPFAETDEVETPAGEAESTDDPFEDPFAESSDSDVPADETEPSDGPSDDPFG